MRHIARCHGETRRNVAPGGSRPTARSMRGLRDATYRPALRVHRRGTPCADQGASLMRAPSPTHTDGRPVATTFEGQVTVAPT